LIFGGNVRFFRLRPGNNQADERLFPVAVMNYSPRFTFSRLSGMTMDNELSVTLKNDIAQIAGLCETVERFAREHMLNSKNIFYINLALEEFLTNIIKYSYNDNKEHLIEIKISLADDEMTIVIEDDGRFFNPLEAPEPDINRPLEEKKIGGLGIHLVRNLFQQLKYERKNDRNIVSLRRKLS